MYPATPGIYPYLHTLSLHDALPISANGEAERNDMTTRRLDFNQKRRAPADLLQKRGKAGRAFLCSLEQYAIQHIGRTAAHRPLFRCQPIKRIVMKDKGHAVTAHLHVTFHAMPRPDCSVKGRAAVFYHPVTVQATMREGLRSQKGDAPGIGRRRKEAVKPGEQRR